jgi:nucleoside-diphosphate-sugar epimerase
MRVLVTGGAGFQGSHLVAELLAKGNDVSILDTPSDRSFLNDDLPFNAYNIGTGVETSINTVVDKIVNHTSSNSDVIYNPSRPGEVSSFAEDSSRLLMAGFQPKIGINQGLEEYIDWFTSYEPWRNER